MYTVEMIKTAGANAGLSPQELNFLCQQLKIRYGSEPQQNSGNTNVLRSLPEIPEWIIKYDKANHQSSAGKAIRLLMERVTQLERGSAMT